MFSPKTNPVFDSNLDEVPTAVCGKDRRGGRKLEVWDGVWRQVCGLAV